MRMLALLVLVVGCQRLDPAEQSASLTGARAEHAKPGAVVQLPTPDEPTQPTGTDQTVAPKSCGCAGGSESCSGSCAGHCGGSDPDPSWGPLPEGTTWHALHVTGMHCGGCARKIERALAKIDGVLGVKIDFHAARVEIAVADGRDARKLVKPVIDGLGYHVD
jgi:copper chaperone CopZ